MAYYACPYCGHKGDAEADCCGEVGHMQYRLEDDERLFFHRLIKRVLDFDEPKFLCTLIGWELGNAERADHYREVLELYSLLAAPGLEIHDAWLTHIGFHWNFDMYSESVGRAFRAEWLRQMAAGIPPEDMRLVLDTFRPAILATAKELQRCEPTPSQFE